MSVHVVLPAILTRCCEGSRHQVEWEGQAVREEGEEEHYHWSVHMLSTCHCWSEQYTACEGLTSPPCGSLGQRR